MTTAVAAPLLGRADRASAAARRRRRSLAILLFASLGLIVGIYAQTWDHNAFVQNLVIQPLAFVGGVFYSVDILPSPWHELTHVNPLFYIVDAIRYGFLGTSDVAPAIAISVTAALAAAMFCVVGVAVSLRAQAEALRGSARRKLRRRGARATRVRSCRRRTARRSRR